MKYRSEANAVVHFGRDGLALCSTSSECPVVGASAAFVQRLSCLHTKLLLQKCHRQLLQIGAC